MLLLQHHKCYHCCKIQDAPQQVSVSVPIMEDLGRYRPKGRPIEPTDTFAGNSAGETVGTNTRRLSILSLYMWVCVYIGVCLLFICTVRITDSVYIF